MYVYVSHHPFLVNIDYTTHCTFCRVDNNLKLYLMLEIFKIEDEKYHKVRP